MLFILFQLFLCNANAMKRIQIERRVMEIIQIERDYNKSLLQFALELSKHSIKYLPPISKQTYLEEFRF